MRNIVLFAGSSHPTLAASVAATLGIPLGRVKLSKFSNRETNVEIGESVRDVDTYILSSGCGDVNDHLMELLIMIAACRTASARKITVVMPCFPYSRQPEIPYYKRNGAPLSRLPAEALAKYTDLVESSSASASPEKPARNANLYPLSVSGLATPLRQESSLSANPFSDGFDSTLDPVDSPTKAAQIALRLRTSSTASMDAQRRISTISMSQPHVQVMPLQPQPPSTMPIPVTHASTSTTGYKHWTARSGTLIANMIMAAGADHIITMDLHDPQFQGLFDIPVDNLLSKPLLVKWIREKVPDYQQAVIVSPDAGGAKRATQIADKLKMDFALIHKERRHHGSNSPAAEENAEVMKLVGNVQGKVCILIDDIADTSHTITRAAQVLHDNGATRILALITHAIMSGSALDRINDSMIDEVIVSNSVPQKDHLAKCAKMKVMDVTLMFAEAIRRIHNGESVSFLFEEVPY